MGSPCCKTTDDGANYQDLGQWNTSEEDPGPDGCGPSGLRHIAFDKSTESSQRKDTLGRGGSDFRQRTVGRQSFDDLGALERKTAKDATSETLICTVLRLNDPLQKFFQLGAEELQALASIAWSQEFDEGDVLMHEGDLDNDTFYIVADGSFTCMSSEVLQKVENAGVAYLTRPQVPRKEKTTLTIGPSSCVGELSMLLDVPRVGTVTAATKSMVWCIDKTCFQKVQQNAMKNQRRSMGTDAKTSSPGSSSSGAKPKDLEWLKQVLSMNLNVQHVASFKSEHFLQLAEAAWLQTYSKDQIITTEGALSADSFFIVESGSVQLTSSQPFDITSSEGIPLIHMAKREVSGTTVHTVVRGTCFGVVAVLYGAPRIFSSKALDSTNLWCISRGTFRQVQRQAAEDVTFDKLKLLDRIPALSSMAPEDKAEVANLLDDISFVEGDTISSGTLCIVLEGSVKVEICSDVVNTLTADRATGVIQYFFGEKQSVKVQSATAAGYVLPSEYYGMLTKSLAQADGPTFGKVLTEARPARLLSEDPEVGPETPTPNIPTARKNSRGSHDSNDGVKGEISYKKLQTVGLLGSTILGPVEHCKHVDTKKSYALRRYSKAIIDKKEMKQCIGREREIWQTTQKIRSKFVVSCIALFNEANSLCVLVEAGLGGPLSLIYPSRKLYGNQDHARYYIACAANALGDLHRHRILLRNLKPDNMLVTETGRLKIGNMGLAKVLRGKSYTTCGTPDYMAPEVLIGSGYSKGIDWFALGVITFELLTEHTPFEAEHPMEVYSRIMQGIGKVEFPDTCKGAVEKFIKALLKSDPVERLAMKQGGVTNVVEHKWYAHFDWKAIRRLDYKPLYVPALENLQMLGEVKPPKVAAYKSLKKDWTSDWGKTPSLASDA